MKYVVMIPVDTAWVNFNKHSYPQRKETIHIEQNLIRETVGSQDQVSVSYGGFNHISFLKNGSFIVSPMKIDQNREKELNQHLMLFFTGVARTAEEVANSYVWDIDDANHVIYSNSYNATSPGGGNCANPLFDNNHTIM